MSSTGEPYEATSDLNEPRYSLVMTGSYPYEAKRRVVALIETLELMSTSDPEQEVQGIALPVLDSTLVEIKKAIIDDPVVDTIGDIISPEVIERGEPVRAIDALLVAKQLDAAIGRPPIVIA